MYFGGLFASLTVFEILMLIFHAAMGSLRVMTALWCLLCGAVAVYGWCNIWPQCRQNGLASVRASLKDWTRTENSCWRFVWGWLCCRLPTRCSTLHTKTGTMKRTVPMQWEQCIPILSIVLLRNPACCTRLSTTKKYVIAGWPIYSSMLSVLSGIHAAIIYRTILPILRWRWRIICCTVFYVISCGMTEEKALIAFVFVYQFFLLAAKKHVAVQQ